MSSVPCERGFSAHNRIRAKLRQQLVQTRYIEKKKHPYDCFTSLSEDKSILMTALWCPAFSNHG